MAVTAAPDFVLVEVEPPERTTKTGIILTRPKTTGAPRFGFVYSVGSRAKKKVDVVIGDRVAIAVELGDVHGFEHDGKKLLSIRPEQVWAKVSEHFE